MSLRRPGRSGTGRSSVGEVARVPMRRALAGAVLIIFLALSASPAAADGVLLLTGELDYEPLANTEDVETVTGNAVQLAFLPEGGAFNGTARLDLAHVVRGTCQFTSAHMWEYSGTYDADQHTFTGTYTETLEQTTGACEGVTYQRTFDPDEGPFQGSVIVQIGRVQSIIPPLRFTMMVDPAIFGGGARTQPPGGVTTTTGPGASDDGGPPTAPVVTIDPGVGPPSTPGDTTADLAGPAVALGALLLAMLVAFGWWISRRGRGGQPPIPPSGSMAEDKEGPCDDATRGRLERELQEAKDRCAEAERQAEEASRRFNEAESRLKAARRDRDGLPSEETRVELPDGTSLSQLDLELRRAAAREAWDAYLADPSPEAAAAAEGAWKKQATPEWLAEQRRAHQARKEALDAQVDAARSELDQAGTDLASARTRQREVCAEVVPAQERLDDCLSRQKPPAEPSPPEPPAPTPEPEAGPPTGATPPAGGPAPPVPPPQAPGGTRSQEREGPCPDGAERFVEVDGPHPFDVKIGNTIRIRTLTVIAGTERTARLGSLETSEATVRLPDGGLGLLDVVFIELSPADIGDLFADLTTKWAQAGSGADQRFVLELEYEVRKVTAVCDRKEVCEGGRWVSRAEWRDRLAGPTRQVRVGPITITGNVSAGFARGEDTYLTEIVQFLRPIQADVRLKREQAELLERYRRECRGGQRNG